MAAADGTGKMDGHLLCGTQLPHAVRVEEKISSADFLLRIVKCIPLFIIIRVIPAALLMLPIFLSLSNSSWPWVQCRTGGDDGSLPSRHQNHSMQKWPAPAAAPASSIGLETDFESSLSSACVSMCRGIVVQLAPGHIAHSREKEKIGPRLIFLRHPLAMEGNNSSDSSAERSYPMFPLLLLYIR